MLLFFIALGVGVGIGLRKEDNDLRDQINKAIGALHKDGTYRWVRERGRVTVRDAGTYAEQVRVEGFTDDQPIASKTPMGIDTQKGISQRIRQTVVV